MKILHIATTDGGGAGGAALRTHINLLDAGISSSFLVLRKVRKNVRNVYEYEFNPYITFLKNKALEFKRKRYREQLKSVTYGRFSFPETSYDKLHEHELVQSCDIVVLHWVADFLDFPSFFRHIQKPVVWRMPDMFPFSGGYHYERFFPKDALMQLLKKNLDIKKSAMGKCKIFPVPLCEWMCKKSMESEVLGSFKHTIIPNGLNTDVFKPHDKVFSRKIFNLPLDKRVLLFVSESVSLERKGLRILIESLMRINHENIHLAILGNNLKLEYHEFSTSFLGYVEDERLLALAYSAADRFIIPSVEDNLPNTVIESLACGTPVVGFNIGGIPDMVLHKQNGHLAKEVNAESLAIAINESVIFSYDTNEIVEDARNRFDKKVQAEKYISLFHEITVEQ